MVTSQADSQSQNPVYQGQFGEFTIDSHDRQEVIIYRAGLVIAALSFAIGSILVLFVGPTDTILQVLTVLFGTFSLGLGISLVTIHIYMVFLHRVLQFFWLVGTVSGVVLAWQSQEYLALYVYQNPLTLFGIGFIFAALTGIFFKEAFCFNRIETRFLTFLVPILLLGHLLKVLPVELEAFLLGGWTILFVIFALRKVTQAIPPDIGDKSVFVYLKQQRELKNS